MNPDEPVAPNLTPVAMLKKDMVERADALKRDIKRQSAIVRDARETLGQLEAELLGIQSAQDCIRKAFPDAK